MQSMISQVHVGLEVEVTAQGLSSTQRGTHPEELFSVDRTATLGPLTTSKHRWLIPTALWDKGGKYLSFARAHRELCNALEGDLVRCFGEVTIDVIHHQRIFCKEEKELFRAVKLYSRPCLSCDVLLVKGSDCAAIRRAPDVQVLVRRPIFANLLMCDDVLPCSR